MSFSITSLEPGLTRVTLEGSMDSATIAILRVEVSSLLGVRPPLVELDLSRLRFVDGSGLGLLLSFIKRLYGQGGALVLSGRDTQPFALSELLSLARVEADAESRN